MIKGESSATALRSHDFLRGLDSGNLERLEALAHDVRFERDQVIFREGETSSFFFLIVSGRVSLEVTALGRTLRVQTVGEGEELGWSSMLETRGKQFQARALENVVAIAFDGARLREACEQDPVFGYVIMKRLLGVVSDRLQSLRMQLLDVYAPPGGGRS